MSLEGMFKPHKRALRVLHKLLFTRSCTWKQGCLHNFVLSFTDFVTDSTVVHMDEGIPEPPAYFTYRYRPARHRMPYYKYYCKPPGPPLPPFVTKRLPKYTSQYSPVYESRYIPPRSFPLPRKGHCVPLYSHPCGHGYLPQKATGNGYLPQKATGNGYLPQKATGNGYLPQKATVCPEPQGTKSSRRNVSRNPRQPYLDIYEQPSTKNPYRGMTNGLHGSINKCLSPPCATRMPLPRVTKGPVIYSPSDLEPHIPRAPLPRMSKGPVLYSLQDLEPHLVETPLPRVAKGPVSYSTKVSQNLVTEDSQVDVTKGLQSHGSKGTLPSASKGPRLLSTKVPRFSTLNLSRSFRKKNSQSNLMKESQASLTKGSRPSLARGSRASLARGSQPSLPIYQPPKKTPKNVKISTTGKKYCSASKWPF